MRQDDADTFRGIILDGMHTSCDYDCTANSRTGTTFFQHTWVNKERDTESPLCHFVDYFAFFCLKLNCNPKTQFLVMFMQL